MATYSRLIQKVLDWSNRDPDIFNITNPAADRDGWTRDNAGLIPDFLEYAADKAYRQLRIPSMEFARNFCVEESDLGEDQANFYGCTVNMIVPDDLIEVIHIRNITKSYVFDEKLDLRTFYQRYADKTTPQFWTRQGPLIKLFGVDLAVGDILEIHYYRRLPALDANWAVTAATFNTESSLYTFATDPNGTLSVGQAADISADLDDTFSADGTFIPEPGVDYTGALFFQGPVPSNDTFPTTTAYDTPFQASDWTTSGSDATNWFYFYFGVSAAAPLLPNWLRDENERILLFGALTELFAFVGEDDMQQKYGQMFIGEIQELNSAEVMRMASGGNVKINYTSHLI